MSRPEILVVKPLMPTVMEALEARFTVHRLWQAADADAKLSEVAPRIRGLAAGGHGVVDKALVDRLPALEIVANFGVGYDNVDAAYCATKGIIVTNTPDVLTEEVADTALGLLLMTVRELSASERYLRAGRWAAEGPYPLTHATLRDRTLGILGLGRIGKAIAQRAEAFGLPIAYHGRRRQQDVPYAYHDSLIGLAEACDTLMLVAPGGEETRHMVGAKVFEALGPRGILINVGRGSVVDEAALIAALQSGTIFAAGLDVFEDEPNVPAELIAMNNVVLLPHVGSASVHTRNAMGQLVVDNLTSWFETGRALTPVAETPQKG